ncbi:EamA family transporter [Micromonospora sp. DT44]|uniref:EamA family transporter n=1 Tax=Micromonospora sp. DT44 TaxID=3393439 RepID=UPI003CF1EDC7
MSSPPPSAAAASGRRADAAPSLVWTALIVVYLLWGSTYLAIRITVETLPPLLSATMRFAVAGLVLAVVLRLRRGPGALRVRPRQLGSAALVGVLLLAGGNGLVVLAESGPPGVALPSGVAALLVATVPLLVVLLRSVTGDRPPLWTFAGSPWASSVWCCWCYPPAARTRCHWSARSRWWREPPPGRSGRSCRDGSKCPPTRSWRPCTRWQPERWPWPWSPPAGAS